MRKVHLSAEGRVKLLFTAHSINQLMKPGVRQSRHRRINALERKRFFVIPELYRSLLAHWHALPARFPGVTLDEFVIMPQHIHGIVWLDQIETITTSSTSW